MMTRLAMTRGDSPVWNLIAYQADGSRLDISSGSLFFTAKSSTRQADVDAVFQKTSGDGITVTDGPNGEFTVELAGSDTNSMYAPATLKYDVQYVTTGSKAYTLLKGDLHVDADVTITIS